MNNPKKFNSLLELGRYFNTEKRCLSYLEEWRWGGKIKCPHCSTDKIYRFADRVRFKCSQCRKQFTAKVGTIFDSSKISLTKWYMAIYLCLGRQKGTSSHQLAKDILVTQKTAWFMIQRIRKALEQKTDIPLSGVVMADETFIGGKNKNRHINKKAPKVGGRSFVDKIPVLGLMEVGGDVRTFVVKDTQHQSLIPIIKKTVTPGSVLVTDEWPSYKITKQWYQHEVVEHRLMRYFSESGFSTNALEGFWAHIKRAIMGVWHNISPKHLQRYVDEVTFKFNFRKNAYSDKMAYTIANCNSVLRYKMLIKNNSTWRSKKK